MINRIYRIISTEAHSCQGFDEFWMSLDIYSTRLSMGESFQDYDTESQPQNAELRRL